jgi:hypothetical protein
MSGDYGQLSWRSCPTHGGSAELDRTSFSYVAWGEVANALGLRVDTTRGNDPRVR